jgi:3-oxoadipate enol-lactonase
MPHIQAGGIRIYYETAGSGPRLLFINGTGADLRNRPNAFDGPLAKAFQVLGYDQRGLGRSEKPDRPYSMQEYADDAAALLDALGWDRAHVMGVSFGGMVAQHLALRHPHRIKRLVLACTSSGGDGGASYPLHRLGDMDVESRARFMIGISDTRHDASWRAGHPEALAAMIEQQAAAAATGADDPLKEMGARRQLEARIHHDARARLGEIRAPVLLCAGRYDGIAPLENMRFMQQNIPDARLEIFEGGHLFLIQDKRAYAEILRFLQQHPPE